MNYEEELRIDDLKLDEECINQPILFMKYSELANEASKELNDHKDFYSVEKGRIEMEIRTGKIDIGDTKLTEGSIKAALESNLELQELKKEVNQKKYDYDNLSSAVSAFDQRKHSIANVIKLIDLGYKSDPWQDKKYDEKVADRAKNRMN